MIEFQIMAAFQAKSPGQRPTDSDRRRFERTIEVAQTDGYRWDAA
jgi:hypothetical protein